MAEMKFNTKGPAGIIVGLLVLAGVVYYQFFMPVYFSSAEKRAILNEIETVRMTALGKLSETTLEAHKKTGKVNDVTTKIEALSGKIKIEEIQGKRTLLSGIKIKVTYTIDGKIPKSDDGVLYFKIHRPKRKKSGRRRSINLYKITESEYNK
jgi:hypothetical protein